MLKTLIDVLAFTIAISLTIGFLFIPGVMLMIAVVGGIIISILAFVRVSQILTNFD